MHVSQLMTITGAALRVGIHRSSLSRAVQLGRVKAFYTADGWPLVRLQDVIDYRANPLPPGPKPGVRKRREQRHRRRSRARR